MVSKITHRDCKLERAVLEAEAEEIFMAKGPERKTAIESYCRAHYAAFAHCFSHPVIINESLGEARCDDKVWRDVEFSDDALEVFKAKLQKIAILKGVEGLDLAADAIENELTERFGADLVKTYRLRCEPQNGLWM